MAECYCTYCDCALVLNTGGAQPAKGGGADISRAVHARVGKGNNKRPRSSVQGFTLDLPGWNASLVCPRLPNTSTINFSVCPCLLFPFLAFHSCLIILCPRLHFCLCRSVVLCSLFVSEAASLVRLPPSVSCRNAPRASVCCPRRCAWSLLNKKSRFWALPTRSSFSLFFQVSRRLSHPFLAFFFSLALHRSAPRSFLVLHPS